MQGVCYRMDARHHASALGLTGWVRNCPDGGVEALAEGERYDLEQFVKWCGEGPAMAVVRKLATQYGDYTGAFEGFVIRY